MINRFEKFTIAILKINKLIRKIKLEEMKEYNLKIIDVLCMYFLNKTPEGHTVSELSRLAVEDKAAVSRAVKSLSSAGYVNADSKRIRITDEGRVVAEYILERADDAVCAAGGNFSDEERDQFYKFLFSVEENLSAYYYSITDGKKTD